jgi:LysM repeat protein/muramidase (phage lysozyme)
MPEPGYDPNAVSSFYNPSSTPTPKLRPSGLGSRPSTADNKGSSAVFSAPKPTYSTNDNNDNSDKRLTPITALYSSTAASLADAGARLAKNSETRITPMNLYDQKNMQEMQTELEDYLRGVDIEDAIAADMARMAVPEVYTGETDDVTVKAGDTLTAIAKDKGVSLQELIDANPQIANPDMIRPGEKVTMPSAVTIVETPTVDTEQDTSTIKGGDVGLMSTPVKNPTQQLLDRIALGEGADPKKLQRQAKHNIGTTEYDMVYNYGDTIKPSKPITEMNLSELADYQKKLINATKGTLPGTKYGTSAVGKYQVVYTSLFGKGGTPQSPAKNSWADKLNLKATTIYSPKVQEDIGRLALKETGYDNWLAGKKSEAAMLKRVSDIWASVEGSTARQGTHTRIKDLEPFLSQVRP